MFLFLLQMHVTIGNEPMAKCIFEFETVDEYQPAVWLKFFSSSGQTPLVGFVVDLLLV